MAAILKTGRLLAHADKILNLKSILPFLDRLEASAVAHQTLLALVSALVREQCRALPAEVREAATHHAVAFTQDQVQVLPQHFRLGFLAALRALDATALGYGAVGFAALPPRRQDRLLTRWATSPIPQTRQFVRLVRSSALLAFFEYPAIADSFERAVVSGLTP